MLRPYISLSNINVHLYIYTCLWIAKGQIYKREFMFKKHMQAKSVKHTPAETEKYPGKDGPSKTLNTCKQVPAWSPPGRALADHWRGHGDWKHLCILQIAIAGNCAAHLNIYHQIADLPARAQTFQEEI